MIRAGSAFLVPSGPAEYLHLHVVCIDVQAQPDMRVLASITSIKPNVFYDDTCVIQPGEHDFIQVPSYVAYNHTQQRSSSKIITCIDAGLFIPKPDVSAKLLERIILGFEKSDFSPPWALKLLK